MMFKYVMLKLKAWLVKIVLINWVRPLNLTFPYVGREWKSKPRNGLSGQWEQRKEKHYIHSLPFMGAFKYCNCNRSVPARLVTLSFTKAQRIRDRNGLIMSRDRGRCNSIVELSLLFFHPILVKPAAFFSLCVSLTMYVVLNMEVLWRFLCPQTGRFSKNCHSIHFRTSNV